MKATIKNLFINETDNAMLQFFRYSFVGGLAALVDTSLFYALSQLAGLHYIAANSLSFLCGLVLNYVLSIRWVFTRNNKRTLKSFAVFSIIGVIGLFISNLLLFAFLDTGFLYSLLDGFNNSMIELSAKIITILLVLLWNFTARKILVFNKPTEV